MMLVYFENYFEHRKIIYYILLMVWQTFVKPQPDLYLLQLKLCLMQ